MNSALPNDKFIKQEDLENDRIRRCLRTDDGLILWNRIDDLRSRCYLQLKTASAVVDIHRYQGQITAYENILKMKEG